MQPSDLVLFVGDVLYHTSALLWPLAIGVSERSELTRARHSIGTASEELHLKSTIQKDHCWLMALWRNPVISLGYLVFSGGQI